MAAARLRKDGLGTSPEWLELELREALLRDGRRLVENLYNDRELMPDTDAAKPLEIRYRNRPHNVLTIFGEVRLLRNYHYHTKSKAGYAPLDEQLNLTGRYSPAVAKLGGRASCKSPSYKEAAEDLLCYAGVDLDPRDLGRLVSSTSTGLKEALAQLPEGITAPKPKLFKLVAKVGKTKAAEQPQIPVLYVQVDGTGTPMRREALEKAKGKGEDGKAKTREAKLVSPVTSNCTTHGHFKVHHPWTCDFVIRLVVFAIFVLPYSPFKFSKAWGV